MAAPQNTGKSQESIIKIIQDMVGKGESEETIVQTLKDLGVKPAQAKKLLLLGQADTFALLRSEITKIVKENVAEQKKDFQSFAEQTVTQSTKNSSQQIKQQVSLEVENYVKTVEERNKQFESQINETVAKVAELSDRVRSKLNELGEQVKRVRLDMDESKISGVSGRNKNISMLLLAAGLLFIALDLYRFVVSFGAIVTVDSVVLTVIFAFVGMGLMFLATQL